MTNYIHYLFEDYESGEEFYVDVECGEDCKEARAEARATAKEYFDRPHLIEVHDDFTFEMNGLDVY